MLFPPEMVVFLDKSGFVSKLELIFSAIFCMTIRVYSCSSFHFNIWCIKSIDFFLMAKELAENMDTVLWAPERR